MYRYRDGRIALQGRPVLARTVEDVARQIGETFEQLGIANLRRNESGRIDARLTGIIAHWKQEDPPPSRVRPIPLDIYVCAVEYCRGVGDVIHECLADMLVIGFFFLCRPGEHTAGTPSCRPFRYTDACLHAGQYLINIATATLTQLQSATFGTLTHTNQKNAVPGEVIGHGRTSHPVMNPLRAIANRIHYLRANGAAADFPLCSHKLKNTWHVVTASQVTNVLRASVAMHGAKYGLSPNQVSARSTRSSGAMAMMCGGVDTSRSRLQGRWKSDIMFRYLMVQHAPLCADISQRMVNGGNFTAPPSAANPNDADSRSIHPVAAPTAQAMALAVAQHSPQA